MFYAKLSQQKYRNIIFDLGGVIVNLNTHSTLQEFSRLSDHSEDEIYQKFINEPAFHKYEKGQISDEEFRALVRETMNIKASDEAIDAAWNAMIYDIPSHRLNWLKQLNERFGVYILSNTNTIHIDYVHKLLEGEHGLINFEGLVNKVYYSHKIGMRKPDQDIFNWLIRENELESKSTIFLDDNIDNINGGIAVGIKSLQVKDPENVPQLLKNEGIEI